jgi:hypothetical protein
MVAQQRPNGSPIVNVAANLGLLPTLMGKTGIGPMMSTSVIQYWPAYFVLAGQVLAWI